MIHLSQEEHEEFLHPLWLGLIMLFAVILGVGMLCIVRRKYGAQLCRALNRFCGTTEVPTDHSKVEKHVSTMGHYNWAPVYVPPPSHSPKLYSLVRNIRMTSFERELTIKQTEINDLEDDLDNDVFGIDQTTPEKTSSNPSALPSVTSEIYPEANRNCETARRFYASMRHTTLGQTISSVESSTTDPPLLSPTRSAHSTRNDKLKFFRTPGFFYSITNKK